MRKLEKITIKNFKSIRDQTLELNSLNVLIGANGSGKSNLIEVFRFLHEAINQNLAGYTAKKGGADNLLHMGRKNSPDMKIKVEFGEGDKSNAYELKVFGTDENDLYISSETAFYHERKEYQRPYEHRISAGSHESRLKGDWHISAHQIAADISKYRIYHFHDTSETASVKKSCHVEDCSFLRPQAENLAAFLNWMQKKHPVHFANVQDIIAQVAPFFDEFDLKPSRLNSDQIFLEWKERCCDAYFNATSLSDGSLRFICLATLLMQPDIPPLVLLDEPELGLHPAAVKLLANMLMNASVRTQVIVATQSTTLVNNFDTEHLWTVEREDNASAFRHLNKNDTKEWIGEYALGDLWDKNLLGARP